MLSTDKQTDRQTNQRYQKHNLLCQGVNKLEALRQRSRLQTSLAEADHYSHILPTVKMLSLVVKDYPPPSPPQKKRFWIITCTTIWVCYHYYGVFFAHLLILQYPDQKKKKKKKGSGSLPAPRSGYATTIMVFFCSFTHLIIPRSPPKFNQFFLLLLWTPP